MINIKNLYLTFKGKDILKNITIQFNEMEIIGICGPADSGKTALLKLIAGSIKPDSGSIVINGKSPASMKKNDMIKICTLCLSGFQDLNRESTVYNFVLSGRIHHKKALNPYQEIDKNIAENIILDFNLEQLRDIKLKYISDSILQTALLARSLTQQNDILLLDNPENFLNINQKKNFFRVMKKYVSSGKKTVIISSGDINFLSNICDRIAIINHGEIIYNNSPSELNEKIIKQTFNTDVILIKNIITGKNEFQIIEE